MKRLTFLALALTGLFSTMIHAADDSRVYELRIYTCNEGKLDACWPASATTPASCLKSTASATSATGCRWMRRTAPKRR
jgi:hypothetical protein